jgi:hypothetical protein
MEINRLKSSITFNGFEGGNVRRAMQIFPYQFLDFQVGFKYLGFYLKPKDYRKEN